MKKSQQNSNNCDCLKQEKINSKAPEINVKKETICFCTPKECDCTVERNQTSKK